MFCTFFNTCSSFLALSYVDVKSLKAGLSSKSNVPTLKVAVATPESCKTEHEIPPAPLHGCLSDWSVVLQRKLGTDGLGEQQSHIPHGALLSPMSEGSGTLMPTHTHTRLHAHTPTKVALEA